MNKLSKYFFLNIYNQNPPNKRISFENLLENKKNEDEILAILLCCNRRNISIFLQHSLIKELCDKVKLEINADSIKILQNEALLHFLQSNNKKRILSIISKLRANHIIYYEEEQNIKITIGGDRNNINNLNIKDTKYNTDFLENNHYIALINTITNLTKDIESTYLKQKIKDIINHNKTFNIAVLGLSGSGKTTLIKALNKTDSIPQSKGITHISNKSANFTPNDDALEVLKYYNKNDLNLQNDVFIQSAITNCNIDIYDIPSICNPFTKVYAQNILNNANLILYVIDVSKEISDIDINNIAFIFKETKNITIVWSHFDLISSDELRIIKKSVTKKLYFVLKRYKIKEVEIINKLDFIATASNIAMMYIQNRGHLALSKGFRVQDSGIHQLSNYIKEHIFNNKEQLKITHKELISTLSTQLKIHIQMMQNIGDEIHFNDELIEEYKAELKKIKYKIYSKITAMTKIILESVLQQNSRINKQILLKIKINDLMNDIFKDSFKLFEMATLNFLNNTKSSVTLNKRQKDIMVLHLNMLKNEIKRIFILKNPFLINAIAELLNSNVSKENFIYARKCIMICLDIENKITLALNKAKQSLSNIEESLKLEQNKDDLKQTRRILTSLITLNKEKQ